MLGPCFLTIGLFLLGIAGAALGWYPSRLGGPAYWIADHVYDWPVSVLTTSPSWPVGAGVLFVVALLGSFGGYVLMLRWARRRGTGQARDLIRVILLQVGLELWLAIQPFISSQDIFSYAFYARMLARYNVNPYVLVPRDLPFDPFFSAIFWKDQPSNYGPLWTYLSGLAPLVAGDRTGLTLLVLKLIAVVASVAGAPLLWSALTRYDPPRRLLGVVLYALNPLLLVESGIAGHNDVVMAQFLIASVWFWVRERRTLAVGSIFLAALTKYVALLLLPFYLVAWLRGGRDAWWVVLARSAAVCFALSLAAFVPIYAGPRTLGVVAFGTNPLAYSNSAMELAFRQIRMALGAPADLAELPLHYNGYWVGVDTSTILWSDSDPTRGTGVALPRGEPLLVVSLPSGQWLHVFEPRIGRFGFVPLHDVQPTAAPPPSSADATTLAVLLGSALDSSAQKSNLILRATSAGIVFATVLFFLGHVRSSPSLFRASLIALLVYLMVAQSWFWPWYLIWALPFAALVPESAAALILLTLTATASVLNAQPNVSPGSTVEWLYEGRMLAIDGIPVLVALTTWWITRGSPRPGWLGRPWSVVLGVVLRAGPALRRAAPFIVVGAGLLAMGLGDLSLWRAATATSEPPVIAWERAYGAAQRDLSAGNDLAAIQELTAVLAERPVETSAVRMRLAANLDMHRFADAIPDVTRLLRDDPSDQSLLLERATLNQQLQRGDRAMADFERIIATRPADATGYAGAGAIAYEQGDLSAAQARLERALAQAPTDATVARQLAAVLATAGKLPEARVLYDRAISLDPTDAQTYAERAAFLRFARYDDAPLPDLHHVLVLSGDVQEHQWAAHLLASLIGVGSRSVEGTE